MNRKALLMLAPVALLLGCNKDATTPLAPDTQVQFSKTAQGGRHGALGVIYVTSQGLYYDTFVSAETLPPKGPFQKLDGVNHTTEFGPGEPGYLGGRWWVDVNGDGMQDAGDSYLLCPLLGPGRTSP